MAGDPEPHPDRPPPAGPVRVARFGGFPAADGNAGGEPAQGRDTGTGGPPTRVAGFDGLDVESGSSTAVAGFDGLDVATGPSTPVAALTALDGPSVPTPVVAALDGLTGQPEDLRPVGAGRGRGPGTVRQHPDPRRTGPRRSERQGTSESEPGGAGGHRPDSGVTQGEERPDDGIPPDRPLPRGRRRGARVGRLGPDAPDPDRPEPEADPVAVAREICLRLLTDRARTRQELARALARKGVPADAAAAVLDRFDQVGLIDDAAFAGQWVRSRHTHRGLGRRAIAVELRRKGVADDVAGEALAEVDAEAEAVRARELVDRRLRSIAVGTAEQRAAAGRRLVGMLARKGYGAATAYGVVREALAERGADVDELGAESVD